MPSKLTWFSVEVKGSRVPRSFGLCELYDPDIIRGLEDDSRLLVERIGIVKENVYDSFIYHMLYFFYLKQSVSE